MNRFPHFLALLFTLGSIRTTSQTLDSGLIAYYGFNETANDSSGNGHHGVLMNNPSFVPAKLGYGIQCTFGTHPTDTSGSHALLPLLGLDTLQSFSISLWVKDSLMNPNSTLDEAYIFYGRSSGHGSIYIFHSNDRIWVGVNEVGDTNYGIAFNIDTSDKNMFVNYVLTYNLKTISAYKNGVFMGSKAIDSLWQITDNYGGIARHWWYDGGILSSTNFNGIIDEVRIYNRALTQSEIRIINGLPSGVMSDLSFQSNEVELVPNPSSVACTLRLPQASAYPRRLNILSLRGQIVYTQLLAAGTTIAVLPTEHLNTGYYAVSVDGIPDITPLYIIR